MQIVLHAALLLAILLGAAPAAALSQAQPAAISAASLLNPDGTLRLDGAASGALDLKGWNVSLNPRRGPVFAPALAPAGEWDNVGSSGLNNGSLSGQVNAIAISGTDVYVGGAFTNVNNGGTSLPEADYVAKWDGTNWSALGSDGAGHGAISGVSVVNALSEWLEADVYRDGQHYHFECERGKRRGPVEVIGPTTKRGTKITFKADEEIFGDVEFNYDTLLKRIREMAYLNANIKITFRDDRAKKKEEFHFPEGIKAFVRHLNDGKNILHNDVIYMSKEDPEARLSCEVAMQYNDGYNENVLVFANNIRNIDGGTHLSGFRTALTRCLLYTSDAADDLLCVDLGGRRIIKKKK